MLATTGAFRVVPGEGSPRPSRDVPRDPRHGDLERLREAGLVETHAVRRRPRRRPSLVTLTERGRRPARDVTVGRDAQRAAQEFYAGVVKPRELAHDAQLYRAYLHAAERLRSEAAIVQRVVLDYELKRDYQRFLQDLNRERRRRGARRRSLRPRGRGMGRDAATCRSSTGTCISPTSAIEYERPDGERKVEDVEVVTPHYRGAYAAAKGPHGLHLLSHRHRRRRARRALRPQSGSAHRRGVPG